MAENLRVTCLCPTYGRFKLLQLALACFLEQKMPEGMPAPLLLIGNDAPGPIWLPGGFRFTEHVEVINWPHRFATLGEKRQALLEAAQTPLVAHWDDDDLYLPHHLERAIAALTGRVGGVQVAEPVGCVKSRGAWYLLGPVHYLRARGVHHNVFEGSMVFRRDEALALGGYPSTHSGQARALMEAFERAGRLRKIADWEPWGLTELDTSSPSYVYRWGQGGGHVSAWKNAADSADRFAAQNQDFGGEYPYLVDAILKPYWAAIRNGPVAEVKG